MSSAPEPRHQCVGGAEGGSRKRSQCGHRPQQGAQVASGQEGNRQAHGGAAAQACVPYVQIPPIDTLNSRDLIEGIDSETAAPSYVPPAHLLTLTLTLTHKMTEKLIEMV